MRLADGTTRESVNKGVAEMGIKTFDRGYALTELLAYRARPDDPKSLAAARDALDALHHRVDADSGELLAVDDLAHHQRLMLVMLVVGLAGAIAIHLSHRTVMAIDIPISGTPLRAAARNSTGACRTNMTM